MLSLVQLSGTPYQIGHALGRFGAEAVNGYLVKSAFWDTVMAWRDTDIAKAMDALVTRHFPAISEEIRGLAAGLQLPHQDVFLWNCRGDLWAMVNDGCTTVQLPSESAPRIVHNEDGDPAFAGYCGLGLFAPDDGPHFASFIYPASIPGHTFAVTAGGLAMTVNNIRSRQVVPGLPRMVLTRAILNQPSIDEAIALLGQVPKSGGFHLSLAQAGRPELVSVEFNTHGVSAQRLVQASVHANHAIHPAMLDAPQVITDSSRSRQERGEALLATLDTDPLAVLADQHNAQFPIYRSAVDDPDHENTLATADIHIGAEHTTWQVHERPHQAPRFALQNAQLA